MSTTFMKVQDVADELGISKSYAYKIVQQLNEELKAQGFITISGRVNKQYFLERVCYATAEKERMRYQWLFIRKKKQILGVLSIAIPIGMANESNHKNEDSKQNVRLRRW